MKELDFISENYSKYRVEQNYLKHLGHIFPKYFLHRAKNLCIQNVQHLTIFMPNTRKSGTMERMPALYSENLDSDLGLALIVL